MRIIDISTDLESQKSIAHDVVVPVDEKMQYLGDAEKSETKEEKAQKVRKAKRVQP